MPVPVPLKILQKLYYDDKLSVTEIAAQVGLSHQAVYARFLKNGISLRERGPRTGLSKEQLNDLYVEQKLTQQEIAEQLRCKVWEVQADLEDYGITRKYHRKSKFSFVESLEVGDQIQVVTSGKYPHGLRRLSKKLAKPVAIRRIDEKTFLIIRIPGE